MAKRAICFVDDDPREIRRFRKHLADRFDIGAGGSIGDALEDLRKTTHRKPDVFLLDMYRFEGPTTSEVEQHKLRDARADVLQAEANFYRILGELRNTTARGFRNLRDVRKKYRWYGAVPVAFFTRKGTLDNAVEAFEEDPPCPVLKKPDPGPKEISGKLNQDQLEQLYDAALEGRKENLMADIDRVIDRFSLRQKYGDMAVGVLIGVLCSLVASAIVNLSSIAALIVGIALLGLLVVLMGHGRGE